VECGSKRRGPEENLTQHESDLEHFDKH
jgi:hypothetical protein